ncbi:MAG: ECF transporter S component [Oscillospiraceae bacterium]|nr:ECF transporter S component [Oscillospiraceae bacterium]
MKKSTKTITFTALLLALGIALPHLAHALGGQPAGAMWLPMHLVAILAGMLLGPLVGLGVGAATPLLRFLIFGMPPVPLLWFMVLEVASYGLFAGLCHKRAKMPVWASLLVSQVTGRGVRMLSLFIAARLLNMSNVAAVTAVITTELLAGLPGIVLQWFVVPNAQRLLHKHVR